MDSEADEYVGGDGTDVVADDYVGGDGTDVIADEDIKQQVAATGEAMEENAMETNAAGDFNMEAGEEMITAQQMKEEAATGHGNEGGDASLAEEAQATDVEEAATGLENEGDGGLAEGENFVTEEQEPMAQEEDKDAQEEEYVPDEQETKAADDEYVPDEQETKAADDDDDYTPYAKKRPKRNPRRKSARSANKNLKKFVRDMGYISSEHDDDVVYVKAGEEPVKRSYNKRKAIKVEYKSTKKHIKPLRPAKNKRSPISHFLRQFRLLQTTFRATERLKAEMQGGSYKKTSSGGVSSDSQPSDAYSFLTYATRRFVVAVTNLIRESHTDFNLGAWDASELGDMKQSHSITRSETRSVVSYLESLFGRLPDTSQSRLFDTSSAAKSSPSQKSVKVRFASEKKAEKKSDIRVVKDSDGKAKIVIGGTNIAMNISNDLASKFKELEKPSPSQRFKSPSAATPKPPKRKSYPVAGADESPATLTPLPHVVIVNDEEYVSEADDVLVNDVDVYDGGADANGDAAAAAYDVRSLYCVFCYKKGFTSLKAFVKHYQAAHQNPGVLDFLLGTSISSQAVSIRLKKDLADGKIKMNYIRCGLCTFLLKEVGDNGRRQSIDELQHQFLAHYIEHHNPQYPCHYCHKIFNIDTIRDLHHKHCPRAIERNVISRPTEKPDIYYYMKQRCGLHKVDFSDEFLYADHMCAYHIHEVDGGEMANLLGLSVKTLLHEYNQRLGVQYVCHMCGKSDGTFDLPQQWLEHVSESHAGRVVCDVCCQFVGSLKMHMKHAHGTKGESYFVCIKPECKYRGAGFPSLYQHILNLHPDVDLEARHEFLRRCVDCDFSLVYQFDKKLIDYTKETRKMVQHYQAEHDKRCCEKCGAFLTKTQYQYHMDKHVVEETGVKPHACSICGQRFTHREKAKDHERRHDEANRTFICHFCSKGYFSKGDLTAHIRGVHEKTHPCDQCDKAFPNLTRLKQHKKQWHEEPSQAKTPSVTRPSAAKKRRMQRTFVYHDDEPLYKLDRTTRYAYVEAADAADSLTAAADGQNVVYEVPVEYTGDLTAVAPTSGAEQHYVTHVPVTSAHDDATAAQVASNMTVGQYYQGDQPIAVTYEEVYRPGHPLSMVVPGFNLATSGGIAYATTTQDGGGHTTQH